MQKLDQVNCNTQIDYTEVIGTRILPFLIELDLENSILNPIAGQNQRFCYTITAQGEDIAIFADLSHWVLGICNQITQDEIVNISVFINGIEQVVDYGEGGNVELKTTTQPDPPTGCPGLKFNFPLNKVNGIMNICFELTTPYPIGPNLVCLFGGNVTASGLYICGPVCESSNQNCPVTAYQAFTVCVPVTITPFAIHGPTTTYCCGNPIITTDEEPCPGTINGSCTFKITQALCVEIPVAFGATTILDDLSVQCGETSNENICINCEVLENNNANPLQSFRGAFRKKTCKKCSQK